MEGHGKVPACNLELMALCNIDKVKYIPSPLPCALQYGPNLPSTAEVSCCITKLTYKGIRPGICGNIV